MSYVKAQDADPYLTPSESNLTFHLVESDVGALVKRAKFAQHGWGLKTVKERCIALRVFKDALINHAEELCFMLSQETGKPQYESLLMEFVVVIDLASYFIKRADKILARQKIKLHLLKNRTSYIHYQPRGVVGILSPWNFPMGIPLCQVFMALIAGNSVVLKPSEKTPKIALKIKEIYDGLGLPKDLFIVTVGKAKEGQALIEAGIDYCIFTGSTDAGKLVASTCAQNLVPCTLELGGKAFAIVRADCDLERTAKALVFGAFANSGQVCASVERVYVHKKVYTELLKLVCQETKKLRQGDPLTQEVDIGHMTTEQQVVTVEHLVKQAVLVGGKILMGGNRLAENSLYFSPTVIADCNLSMDLMHKEIFGPVLPLMCVENDDQAIEFSNNSPYGLMGYIFTKDKAYGRILAEKMRAGTVMINDTIITFGAPETPWGGFGQSGIGFTHGEDGLKELCQKRHVNEERFSFRTELWWFPYKEIWRKRITNIMKKSSWILDLLS